MIRTVSINTRGQGLNDITASVEQVVRESGCNEGLCSLLVRHTSASLVIQENADPSARADLENWMARLVPEHDPIYTHTLEGADDMPAHIRSMLTQATLSIPFGDQRLLLGTWQGIYLWEHRRRAHQRQVVIHVGGQ